MDGFNDDAEYWTGYFDSWDTLDDSPVYYSGDTIPNVDTPPYDSGYYDGQWYAYHDGYFVAYRYAFVIGFSEGYDSAFWPDYLDFLAQDQHIEYHNGGFGDGYMDGYSEGRVFGAYDYSHDIDFDWLDALLDYESGTDVTVGGVSTGQAGPVDLYLHGQDPNDLSKSIRKMMGGRPEAPAIRKTINIDELPLFRPLTDDAKSELDVTPTHSLRGNVELTLESSWLQRINQYVAAETKAHTTGATRTAK
jgi:hypothetical protein